MEDKFGDNGTTGVMIVRKKLEERQWVIDSFLLSCRVLGKNVEKAFLSYLIEEAKAEGIETLIGEFIKTEKNAPAMNVFKENDFQLENKEEDIEIWKFDLLNSDYKNPEDITIIKED